MVLPRSGTRIEKNKKPMLEVKWEKIKTAFVRRK